MKHHISFLLALTFALCPALQAAGKKETKSSAKSAYPTHVVSLYDAAKKGYYELKGKGYKSDQITIKAGGIVGSYTTAHTIGDVTYYNTYESTIPCEIEAYKLGLMDGDKAATTYRQTAEYAVHENDSEIAEWLNKLLGADIVRNHQSWFLSGVNTLAIIGIPLLGIAALIFKFQNDGWRLRHAKEENRNLKYERDRLKREYEREGNPWY